MRCPRTVPIAKSEASHMILNGLDQFGVDMIGAEITFFLSFSQEFIHSSSKMKDVFLAIFREPWFVDIVNYLITNQTPSH